MDWEVYVENTTVRKSFQFPISILLLPYCYIDYLNLLLSSYFFNLKLLKLRKKKFFLLVLIFTNIINSNAQVPAIEWKKSYGGYGSEQAKSVQQTIDGGYIIAGNTSSSSGDVTYNYGNDDYWIVKLDKNGTIEWQKSYGGSQDDYAVSIKQTLIVDI